MPFLPQTEPAHGWSAGSFEHARAISGQTMTETILVNRGTCFACAVACKREVAVPEDGVTPKYGGPEYETLAASGSLCGVGDLRALARVIGQCDPVCRRDHHVIPGPGPSECRHEGAVKQVEHGA